MSPSLQPLAAIIPHFDSMNLTEIPHISGIMQYLSFCDQLILFSIMSSRCISVIVYCRSSFFFVFITLLVYSFYLFYFFCFLGFFFTFYFLIINFFIGVQFLYNAVSVSAVQQSESAICIHIYPLFWISFPFRSPQSTEQSSLCYTVGSHQLSVLYIVVYICQSQSPNSSHTSPFQTLGIHMFVLYVCVSTSALQIRSSTPFFQVPHICVNI